jgi:hypothetical protein
MCRSNLERLSREELIELVLRLQRLDKTSRTSSMPPATDRKERQEQSKPDVVMPGHDSHSRVLSHDRDTVVEYRSDCRQAMKHLTIFCSSKTDCMRNSLDFYPFKPPNHSTL